MYLEYFGLSEAPFAITPDPTFVFLSPRHRDALAHLLYGVGQGGSGGFVQLTGEVGTGKTTLCRCLLEQVPENTRIALILNPTMTPHEMLAAVCEELGIETSGAIDSSKELVDRLNRYLLEAHEAGWRVVLVIDEAQNLSPEALEQVRLLTNLETSKQKLLQIVLLGQPELRDLLQRRNLRQLAQRITARYHLTPLEAGDCGAYVAHRLQVAGAQRNPFRRSAIRALYRRSQGVPRLINIIADRALVGAYARERGSIDARLVNEAANEVQLGEPGVRRLHWRWAAGLLAALFIITATAVYWPWQRVPEPRRQEQQVIPMTASPDNLTMASEYGESVAGVSKAENTPPDGQTLPFEPQSPPAGTSERLVAGTGSEATETVSEPGEDPGEAQPSVAELPSEPLPEAIQDLDQQWLSDQARDAWASFAELWGDRGAANAIQASCDGQAGRGYACLTHEGSLSRIRRLGLPVLLVLPGPSPTYLLLQGIDGDRLLVGVGESARTVRRADVENRWLGGYVIAWPQAAGWPAEIRRGNTGKAVDVIMDLAALAEPPYNGGRVFDATFEAWLRGFQLQRGLDADGIIGPNTLLHLMAPSIESPRLLKSWAPGS